MPFSKRKKMNFGEFNMKLEYPILKEWAIIINNKNPYMSSDEYPKHCIGKVYGNPRSEDGKVVITSKIIRFIEEQDAVIAETKHSRYILRKTEMAESFAELYGRDKIWNKLKGE